MGASLFSFRVRMFAYMLTPDRRSNSSVGVPLHSGCSRLSIFATASRSGSGGSFHSSVSAPRNSHTQRSRLNSQLLIRLITSYDVQQSGVVRAPLLLHDECSIRCTQQAVGAGDHIEAVLGFHLPGVMDHQQADAVPVTEGFQPGHDLVVAGVAVSIPADLPHLLQGFDDDEPYIRVLPDEAFQLLVKSPAHELGLRCEVEIAGLLHPEHPGEPPLQPGVIVL